MKIRSQKNFSPVKPYDRTRDFAWLTGQWLEKTLKQQEIVYALEKALERQQRAARCFKANYDINKHYRLLMALKAEKAALSKPPC